MTSRDELEMLDRDWVDEKERHGSVPRLVMLRSVGLFNVIAGLGLVMLGLWLHELGDDVRLERLLHPWPVVCMVLGPCLAIGSLAFTFGYVHPRLRAFIQAKCSYDCRREKLLQDIYVSGKDLDNREAD